MPITADSGRCSRSARRTAAAAVLVMMLLAGQLLALLAAAPSARAAPEDRPVDIVIASVTPKVGAPGMTIQVSGILVNTTDIPVTDLTVRLQRGPALESRTDLADNESEPVEVNEASTPFVDLAEPLAGSDVLPFTYTTTPEALRLSGSAAYPLLINLNGQAGSDPASRVGEQVVLLPYFSEPPTATTQLSWLWPLVATPERGAAGVFKGTDLAASLGPGGRLDRALAVIEGAPGTNGSTGAARPSTLAVDPELLEAVRVLADGDYQVILGGQQQTSSLGSTDAAIWLARLRTLAVSLPVISLPYADPDIATLVAQGQGRAVERLLPDETSADLFQDILGVAPVPSIAWPPDGDAADLATLETLAEHGITQVVADESLTFLGRPDAPTLDAVSTIETGAGPISALTADHALSGLLAADLAEAGTRAMTEQRFLAELVVTASEDPEQGRHLLLAPARDFDPAAAEALLAAASGQSWLGSELATDLVTAVEPAARTVLPPSGAASLIPEAQLSVLIEAMQGRDDFASALSDPDSDLLSLDRALARAATSNRGPTSLPGQAAVLDVAAAVAALQGTVGIVAPANGTYSLASADAPLVLTVFNDNPFPVQVTVALAPRGAPGVTTTNVDQELPAQTRTTIAVPANVQRSGSFTVIATVSSPAGTALGAPVQLRVQSTVYGPVALAITFGAAALLALLFARRSVKYWRGRRAGGAGPGVGALDEESRTDTAISTGEQTALVDPPPRSPV